MGTPASSNRRKPLAPVNSVPSPSVKKSKREALASKESRRMSCLDVTAEVSLAEELEAARRRVERTRRERERTEAVLKRMDLVLEREMREVERRGEEQRKVEEEFRKLICLINPGVCFPNASPVKSLREREKERRIVESQLKETKSENGESKMEMQKKGKTIVAEESSMAGVIV